MLCLALVVVGVVCKLLVGPTSGISVDFRLLGEDSGLRAQNGVEPSLFLSPFLLQVLAALASIDLILVQPNEHIVTVIFLELVFLGETCAHFDDTWNPCVDSPIDSGQLHKVLLPQPILVFFLEFLTVVLKCFLIHLPRDPVRLEPLLVSELRSFGLGLSLLLLLLIEIGFDFPPQEDFIDALLNGFYLFLFEDAEGPLVGYLERLDGRAILVEFGHQLIPNLLLGSVVRHRHLLGGDGGDGLSYLSLCSLASGGGLAVAADLANQIFNLSGQRSTLLRTAEPRPFIFIIKINHLP
jgi:hypothetical protein